MKLATNAVTGTVAVALLTTSLALTAPPSPGTGWRITREDLVVRLDMPNHAMDVHGEATITPSQSSDTAILWVNSGQHTTHAIMTFVHLDAAGATDVELNRTDPGYPGSFFTTIHFAHPIAAGEPVALSFDVKSLRGNGFTFTIATPVAVVEGANGWYPQALDPDGKLDAERDQPPGRTTFVLPAGFRSVSNGSLLDSTTVEGGTRETWALDVGAPRSFAVGPYGVKTYRVGTITVGLFSLPGTDASAHIRELVDALTVLQSEYGPFPYSRYDVAEVGEDEVNWAGLAARELTVEQSFVFKKPDAILFFSHEAAHAWWGNLVGKTGPGIFMVNEAMAQYSAFTVLQQIQGQRSYIQALDDAAHAYFSEALGRPSDKPLSTLVDALQSDYDLSIDKGVWVYHMLRERVGDDIYFGTFRGLAAQFAGKEMSLADIRRAFVRAAPAQADLTAFFAQWLDRKGAPVVTWSAARPGVLLLRQWQPGAAYHVTLPVVVHCGSTTLTLTASVTQRQTVLPLKRACVPTSVELDPAHTTLIWRPQYAPVPMY